MVQDVIKYRACFLIAISMLATFTLQAQVNSEKLRKRVTIYKDVMRVDSFLNLLSKQTGVGFSFNSKKISPTKMIAMKKGKYSMADCLAQIQRNSGIHYAMMNNHIILVDNPPQEKYRLTLPAKEPVANKTTVARSSAAAKKTGTRSTTTNRSGVSNSTSTAANRTTTSNTPGARSAAPSNSTGNRTGAGTTRSTNSTAARSTSTAKPDSNSSLTHRLDSLTKQTQHLSGASKDSALNKNNAQPQKDSTKTVAQPPSTNTTQSSRAAAAKARQQAAAAAAAAAAADDEEDADTETNLMMGAAVLRPDIYDMFGVGLNIQFEMFLSNKISFTAAAGFQQIFGEYIAGAVLDTSGIPVADSLHTNFAQIPVLLGARYYAVRPFYAAFEAGYTFKASENVSSYLTFSPSLGVKIPVGDSNIDINIKYLYLSGKATIPEKPRLMKGDFGFWSLRVAYAFK